MKGKRKQLGIFERRELTPEAERLLGNFEVVAGAPGGVRGFVNSFSRWP